MPSPLITSTFTKYKKEMEFSEPPVFLDEVHLARDELRPPIRTPSFRISTYVPIREPRPQKRVKLEPGLLPYVSPPPSDDEEFKEEPTDDEREEEEKKEVPLSRPPRSRSPPRIPKQPHHLRRTDKEKLDEWLKSIPPEKCSYGGDWFSMLRFVRMLEDVCAIPISQFDFDSWRIYTYSTPARRPNEGPELRRMLEWFGQLGYYIVWSWQRINYERPRDPFTLWELIDNTSTLTNFVALIQLVYTSSADDRGLKDSGRANARSRELQRREKILTLASYPSHPQRDEAIERQIELQSAPDSNDTLETGLRVLNNALPPPPRRDLTSTEQLVANKHLLLKWCAQACGVNTTTQPYRIEEEKLYVEREIEDKKDSLGVKLEDPVPTMEVLPQFRRRSVDYTAVSLPLADTLREADWKRANPGREPPDPKTVVNPPNRLAPVSSTPTTNLLEQSLAAMDVNVKQMFRQGVENLRQMSNGSTSEQIEYRLLIQGTLCDHIFFAQYCSILSAGYRGYSHRSRLPGIVRNKLSTEWDDLTIYFKRWATRG